MVNSAVASIERFITVIYVDVGNAKPFPMIKDGKVLG